VGRGGRRRGLILVNLQKKKKGGNWPIHSLRRSYRKKKERRVIYPREKGGGTAGLLIQAQYPSEKEKGVSIANHLGKRKERGKAFNLLSVGLLRKRGGQNFFDRDYSNMGGKRGGLEFLALPERGKKKRVSNFSSLEGGGGKISLL